MRSNKYFILRVQSEVDGIDASLRLENQVLKLSVDGRLAFIVFADGAKVEFLSYNITVGAKYLLLGRTYPMDEFML